MNTRQKNKTNLNKVELAFGTTFLLAAATFSILTFGFGVLALGIIATACSIAIPAVIGLGLIIRGGIGIYRQKINSMNSMTLSQPNDLQIPPLMSKNPRCVEEISGERPKLIEELNIY